MLGDLLVQVLRQNCLHPVMSKVFEKIRPSRKLGDSSPVWSENQRHPPVPPVGSRSPWLAMFAINLRLKNQYQNPLLRGERSVQIEKLIVLGIPLCVCSKNHLFHLGPLLMVGDILEDVHKNRPKQSMVQMMTAISAESARS